MEQSTFVPPKRDLAWFRNESRAPGLGSTALGAVSLASVIVGGTLVVVRHGLTPVANLHAGLSSGALRAWALSGIVTGLAAVVLGVATFRRMPTKLAREESITGALLGVQGALAGGAVLLLQRSDLELIIRNFLNFELVAPHVGTFVHAAKNTLYLAFGAELFGIALGLVLAIFLVSKRAVTRAAARIYVNFFRGTPLIWQLSAGYFGIVLVLGVPLSVFNAGMMILGLNAGAYLAEVFRAGIQSIERSQLDAARGLGMSYLQAMRHAVLPQAIRRVIPPLTNEFVILIKDTALIFTLGLTFGEYELYSAGRAGYSRTFNATFLLATAAGYLIITLPLIRLVTIIERRLRSGLVGVSGA